MNFIGVGEHSITYMLSLKRHFTRSLALWELALVSMFLSLLSLRSAHDLKTSFFQYWFVQIVKK